MTKRGLKQIISVMMCVFVCLVFAQVVVAEDFDYTDPETGVKFHADEGILPDEAMILVRQLTPGVDEDKDADKEFVDLLENLDEVVRKQVEKLDAYIIELYDGNSNKIQPDGYVSVMIPVTDDFDQEDLEVLRVVQGEDVIFESDITEIDGQKYCVFKTNHFSTYCLIDKIGKSDVGNSYLPYVVYGLALVSLVCLAIAMRRPPNHTS